MQKHVFISHRSTDKNYADLILSFLTRNGVHPETVFCSSLPGNDIKHNINLEIKDAFKTCRCNIAILSKDYYSSVYCQNELGIIWYLDVPKVVIALSDIDTTDMIGFLDNQNIINRLDNRLDIERICGILKSALPGFTDSIAITNENINKLMQEYESELPPKDPIDETVKNILDAIYSV